MDTPNRRTAQDRSDDPGAVTGQQPAALDAESAAAAPPRPLFGLSLTQVVGGSLAAASGAALVSGLGVAGTIVGAATISAVSAVGGAVYTQSLRHTGQRVRIGTRSALRTSPAHQQPQPTPAPAAVAPPPRPTRVVLRARSLVLGTAAVFTLALAGITGYELATGHPVSGSGSSTTTLGEIVGTAREARTTPRPTPTTDSSTPTGTAATPTGTDAPGTSTAGSSESTPPPGTSPPATTTVSPDPTATEPTGTTPAPTEPTPIP